MKKKIKQYDKSSIERVVVNNRVLSRVTLLFERKELEKYAKRMRGFGVDIYFGESVIPGLKPFQQPIEEAYWYAMFFEHLMICFEKKLREEHTIYHK